MKKVWYVFLLILIALGLKEIFHLLSVGQIATNASDRVPWGLDAVVYMFTAGIGAGVFLIAASSLFGVDDFKPIFKSALIFSIISVAIAPINLFLAMGHPEKFMLIFFSPNPTSAIVLGAYCLPVFLIVMIAMSYFVLHQDTSGGLLSSGGDAKKVRFLCLIGIPVSLVCVGYTGLLLGLSRARVLWHTALMPVLFFVSSIVSAAAVLIIISKILQKKCGFNISEAVFDKLGKVILVGILFDLLFLAGEIIVGVYGRSGEHFEAWSVLLNGSFSVNFYLFQLVIGAIIPLCILMTGYSSRKIIIASACALIGVFAMRYNIIIGGQIVQPSGGPLGYYSPNLGEWSVVVGLWALAGILFTLAIQKLPLKSTIEVN